MGWKKERVDMVGFGDSGILVDLIRFGSLIPINAEQVGGRRFLKCNQGHYKPTYSQ